MMPPAVAVSRIMPIGSEHSISPMTNGKILWMVNVLVEVAVDTRRQRRSATRWNVDALDPVLESAAAPNRIAPKLVVDVDEDAKTPSARTPGRNVVELCESLWKPRDWTLVIVNVDVLCESLWNERTRVTTSRNVEALDPVDESEAAATRRMPEKLVVDVDAEARTALRWWVPAKLVVEKPPAKTPPGTSVWPGSIRSPGASGVAMVSSNRSARTTRPANVLVDADALAAIAARMTLPENDVELRDRLLKFAPAEILKPWNVVVEIDALVIARIRITAREKRLVDAPADWREASLLGCAVNVLVVEPVDGNAAILSAIRPNVLVEAPTLDRATARRATRANVEVLVDAEVKEPGARRERANVVPLVDADANAATRVAERVNAEVLTDALENTPTPRTTTSEKVLVAKPPL